MLEPLSEKASTLRLGEYEHYKKKRYRVLGVARSRHGHEEVVVYQALYDEKYIWTRTVDDFLVEVEVDSVTMPRFKFVGK